MELKREQTCTDTFLLSEPVVQPAVAGNSFTELLELSPNQAVMLLHSPEVTAPKTLSSSSSSSSVCLASMNNMFNTSTSYPNLLKLERIDSDSVLVSKSTKRKERERNVKLSAKKSKSVANEMDGEERPYVHVRARRGQATDSHSLAERARREKINARMKLLQELVPGCNKISGTAMVLDEIINHVQSLQRQVEFLSMRLAALCPNIDINIDSIISAESGSLMDGNLTGMVSPPLSHQIWQPDGLTPQPLWGVEEMNPNFITPDPLAIQFLCIQTS